MIYMISSSLPSSSPPCFFHIRAMRYLESGCMFCLVVHAWGGIWLYNEHHAFIHALFSYAYHQTHMSALAAFPAALAVLVLWSRWQGSSVIKWWEISDVYWEDLYEQIHTSETSMQMWCIYFCRYKTFAQSDTALLEVLGLDVDLINEKHI